MFHQALSIRRQSQSAARRFVVVVVVVVVVVARSTDHKPVGGVEQRRVAAATSPGVCTREITAPRRLRSVPAGPSPALAAAVALSDTDNAVRTPARLVRGRVASDRPPDHVVGRLVDRAVLSGRSLLVVTINASR